MEWKPDYVNKALCSHNLAPRGLWVRDCSRAGDYKKSPGPAELRRELKENSEIEDAIAVAKIKPKKNSLSSHHLSGYIQYSLNDQLPVGLMAQLVERCTGIAEIMGSNPVQA